MCGESSCAGSDTAVLSSIGDTLWRNWLSLEEQAGAWLEGERMRMTSRRRVHALDMRYAGQSFSITTAIPEEVRDAQAIEGVLEAFHRAHELIYGFREQDTTVEAVTQRLSIIGHVPKLDLPRSGHWNCDAFAALSSWHLS